MSVSPADLRPFSNELTRAQLERLAILSEELGEAQQCIGKILRHGYDSHNPVVNTGMTNRRELERELGDIALAGIEMRRKDKAINIQRWLHHQEAL